MTSKLVSVFDEYSHYKIPVNIDRIISINQETGEVMFTGGKCLMVDKTYIETIKECFGYNC